MSRNPKILTRRPEVQWFSCEMESVLRANDHKGGWHGEGTDGFLLMLRTEMKELEDAVEGERDAMGSREEYVAWSKKVIREAVDVANFAMMIADNSWT